MLIQIYTASFLFLRPTPTKPNVYKEKLVENAPVKRRYSEDGREYIIETDRKYFMVEAEQLLQLFKRFTHSNLQWII